MGRLRDKQWGWGDTVVLVFALGLVVFLAPLFLIYAVAQPSQVTMVMLFGVDLGGWIVAGVVGALAWSISGTRRIVICTSCNKLNVVSGDDAVCGRCKAPLTAPL